MPVGGTVAYQCTVDNMRPRKRTVGRMVCGRAPTDTAYVGVFQMATEKEAHLSFFPYQLGLLRQWMRPRPFLDSHASEDDKHLILGEWEWVLS